MRSPTTGQLVGRGRSSLAKRLIEMRDSIYSIKRYLYRRITSGAFSPLSREEVDESTLRRLVVWLQPTRCTPPTKTEVYCFNAVNQNFKNKIPGIGTPAVLFPPDNSRTRKEFFQPTYGRLKEWVYTKRCIPGALLELLSGKSFKKRRDSVSSQITVLRRSLDLLNLPRRPFRTCGAHGAVAILRSQTGFVLHHGDETGFRLTMTANKFSVLSEETPSP